MKLQNGLKTVYTRWIILMDNFKLFREYIDSHDEFNPSVTLSRAESIKIILKLYYLYQ